MGVNKVVYGGKTLVDMTDVTVAPETLVKGATAYNSAGEMINGKAEAVNCYFKTESKTFPVGSFSLAN